VIPITANALGLDKIEACARVFGEVILNLRRQRFSIGRSPLTVTCAAALAAALLAPSKYARAADARYLKGIVVAPPERPGKPRPIADAVVHVRGAKDAPSTDEDGRFWLILPPEMKPGDALTIDAEKEGYRLWLPSGGATGGARVPADLDKNLLELQLVPVGSKRFLSPPAIEMLVAGMMARAREQIGHDPHPAQIRLEPYLREWATRYGLSFKAVKAAVDGWAIKTKNNRQSTPAQKSQAAFVRHELADAARFSHAAVAAAIAEETGFDKEATALAARKRAHGDAMRELLKKEADADFLSLQFEPALEVYRRMLGLVDKKDDPTRWAAASIDVARAEQQLAAGQPGTSALPHLQHGAEACRDALKIYTREQFPKEWASAENDLGAILDDQAKLATGNPDSGKLAAETPAKELLGEAAAALQLALEVSTREQHPEAWAATSANLSRVLVDQAQLTGGSKGDELLARAGDTLKATLEVRTADRFPNEWAATQVELGAILQIQGERATDDKGDDFLARSADAFRFALKVRTREQVPADWAATESALGHALTERGKRTSGPKGDELLTHGADAFRAALKVSTRERAPRAWAATEVALGGVLEEQGKRATDAKGDELLAQAVEAFQLALQVRTRELAADEWAATQDSLGGALDEQGTRAKGEKSLALLAKAIEAYRQSLEIRTREKVPRDWASTKANLGTALDDLGVRTEGEPGDKLLAESAGAFQKVLEVFTREETPRDWAMAQNNLGTALADQARRAEGATGEELLDQAVRAFNSALEVCTRQAHPRDWAMTQNNLGTVLEDQGRRREDESGNRLLAQAVDAYRSALQVYTKEEFPQAWSMTEDNLGNILNEIVRRQHPAETAAVEH
jgi:tetratricopeptide (TPR) repeat protein